mgnify:CR=1 FL=1
MSCCACYDTHIAISVADTSKLQGIQGTIGVLAKVVHNSHWVTRRGVKHPERQRQTEKHACSWEDHVM